MNALELADLIDQYGKPTEDDLAFRDELRRLHQICRDIYEVWAGSEGIPVPETAAEAYLLQLIEQMRDLAKEGLK